MDWLAGMNAVVRHIEENLTEEITLAALAKIVGVSSYEFSRIFSFMAGMSVSEYIRRRRLSQAVFDIQDKQSRIIDVAVKFGYESQATFSRAFKELHGTTPLSARKSGVGFKTYPPISFTLSIKGSTPLDFRMEKQGEIQGFFIGLTMDEEEAGVTLPTLFSDAKTASHFGLKNPTPRPEIPENEFETYIIGSKEDPKLKIGWKGEQTVYHLTCAYDCTVTQGKLDVFFRIGEDDPIKHEKITDQNGTPIDLLTIPPSDWAVFSFNTPLTNTNVAEAYARILTEWFPTNQHARNQNIPHMEKFPFGRDAENRAWEIWMPIITHFT